MQNEYITAGGKLMKHKTLSKRVKTFWKEESTGIEYSLERTVKSDKDDNKQKQALKRFQATGLLVIR